MNSARRIQLYSARRYALNLSARILGPYRGSISRHFLTRRTVAVGREWFPAKTKARAKKKSTQCRKGNKTLRRVLTQAAWAAVSHTKKTYLRAFYQRVKARRGSPKAIVATGHKILVIAFHVLKNSTPYIEPGRDYFDRLNPVTTARKLVQRLEALGLRVQLSPMATI